VPEDQVDQLARQVTLLTQRVRREQPAVEGLSRTELHVLTVAEGADTPLRPGQLAEKLQMTTPNVATALRRLEHLGMVVREHDADDGRQRHVLLTEAGRTIVAKARCSRHSWLRHAIENNLSEAERQMVFLAGHLMQRLAEEKAGTRSADRGGVL
jgi:DNA-binding MarR family transcriptional regulator